VRKLQLVRWAAGSPRVEPRRRARALVLGPLADLPPMNAAPWVLAVAPQWVRPDKTQKR